MTRKVPFFRTPYNYDMNAAGDESALKCEDESLAKQSFAEECDINTIVRRFHLHGELPEDVRMPTYGDFTGVSDFHSAMNAVRSAAESFMAMPAEVRARFGNDAGAFVDFCSKEENWEEAQKLGMLLPEKELLARDEPSVAKARAAAAAAKAPTEPQAGSGARGEAPAAPAPASSSAASKAAPGTGST